MMVGKGSREWNGRKALISRSLNYLLEFVAFVLPLYFSTSQLDLFSVNNGPSSVLLQALDLTHISFFLLSPCFLLRPANIYQHTK